MPRRSVARTKDEVEAWLEHQGYKLEHQASTAFRKAGFKCRIGQPYQDPIEEKIREIDVVAQVLIKSDVDFWIAVECKASTTGAWVIRTAQMSALQKAWMPLGSHNLVNGLFLNQLLLESSLTTPVPTGFHVIEAAPKDGAYDAVNQAISGAFAFADRYWEIGRTLRPEPVPERYLIYPVVVLDGPLFVVEYASEAGVGTVRSVESYRVIWSASPVLNRPTAVDIVTASALPASATSLRHELAVLADLIADNEALR